jgi:hypothetical protein
MNNDLPIINVMELSPVTEYFVPPGQLTSAEWVNVSGLPDGWLEKYIKKPKISRYRAAFRGAKIAGAKNSSIVISHMPVMTAAVSIFLTLMRKKTRHIAFAFNFTEIPSGIKKWYLKLAFRSVDEFIVFSEYEKRIYSEALSIPEDKIRSTIWTQEVPPVRGNLQPPFDGAYLCAIGGEGRDFRCLINAAAVSGIDVAVIARPHNLVGLAIPNNVRVFTNIPLDETWAIAKGSSGVVVPLLSNDTCCGQITIVSAQMLGLPVITNFSHALKEYLSGEGVALLFEPGDASGLAEKMLSLLKNRIEFLDIANRASGYYLEKYRRSLWAACLKETIEGRAN